MPYFPSQNASFPSVMLTPQDPGGRVPSKAEIDAALTQARNAPPFQVPDQVAPGNTQGTQGYGITENGYHIVIPRMAPDGQMMTEDEAIDAFHRTGQHLGVFSNQKAMDAFVRQLNTQSLRSALGRFPSMSLAYFGMGR